MKNLRHFAGFLALGALLGPLALAADPAAPAPGRSTSVPLAPDAPSSYTVQRGDTLWGIASKYLSQPWYWPEIWYLNPDIKNPHRIYPGDTLHLVYVDGGNGEMRPEIRVERGNQMRLEPQVRSLPLSDAIPAIPYEIVAAFMSKPSVVARNRPTSCPTSSACATTTSAAGVDDTLYVPRHPERRRPARATTSCTSATSSRIPRPTSSLGYQAIYAGRARLDRAGGPGKDDLAKLRRDRVGTRDARRRPADAPRRSTCRSTSCRTRRRGRSTARSSSMLGGTNVIGQYQVVVVNRGKRDGLEPGHVLEIWQRGDSVKDRGPGGVTAHQPVHRPFSKNVRLPNERAGTFMVFKAYDRPELRPRHDRRQRDARRRPGQESLSERGRRPAARAAAAPAASAARGRASAPGRIPPAEYVESPAAAPRRRWTRPRKCC